MRVTNQIAPSVIATATGRFPWSAGTSLSSDPVNAAAITGSDAQMEIQYPHATMKPAKSPYAARVYAYGPPVAGMRSASRAKVRPRQSAPAPITAQKMMPSNPYGATADGDR